MMLVLGFQTPVVRLWHQALLLPEFPHWLWTRDFQEQLTICLWAKGMEVPFIKQHLYQKHIALL